MLTPAEQKARTTAYEAKLKAIKDARLKEIECITVDFEPLDAVKNADKWYGKLLEVHFQDE